MRLSHFLTTSLLLLLSSSSSSAAASPPKKDSSSDDSKPPEDVLKPCTIRSPNTGSFFDLNPLHITLPDPDSSKSTHETSRNYSWHARGYDYGANFTINFCGGVVEDMHDVVGVQRHLWRNVSAFYEKDGKMYSIGQQNEELVIRGRKLVLNYTDGSPCPAHAPTRRSDDSLNLEERDHDSTIASHPLTSPLNTNPRQASERRKSSIFSLLCERDPLAAKASVSFVGASHDECTYFFELRSSSACPAVNVEKQQVGPSAVFGLIAIVAFLAYFIGGIAYQRAVLHQRGWRQLPNYAFWSGIFGFIKDMLLIVFYSIITCCRRRTSKRFNQVNGPNGIGNGRRGGGPEDENRIIDNLDEEWED